MNVPLAAPFPPSPFERVKWKLLGLNLYAGHHFYMKLWSRFFFLGLKLEPPVIRKSSELFSVARRSAFEQVKWKLLDLQFNLNASHHFYMKL
jgi:hypothetical protein